MRRTNSSLTLLIALILLIGGGVAARFLLMDNSASDPASFDQPVIGATENAEDAGDQQTSRTASIQRDDLQEHKEAASAATAQVATPSSSSTDSSASDQPEDQEESSDTPDQTPARPLAQILDDLLAAWQRGALDAALELRKELRAYAPLTSHTIFRDHFEQAKSFEYKALLISATDRKQDAAHWLALFERELPRYLPERKAGEWESGELAFLAELAAAAMAKIPESGSVESNLRAILRSPIDAQAIKQTIALLSYCDDEQRRSVMPAIIALSRDASIDAELRDHLIHLRFSLASPANDRGSEADAGDVNDRLAMLNDPALAHMRASLLLHGLSKGLIDQAQALTLARTELLANPDASDAAELFEEYQRHAGDEGATLARTLMDRDGTPHELLRAAMRRLAQEGESEREELATLAASADANALYALEALQHAQDAKRIEQLFERDASDDAKAASLTWLAQQGEASKWVEKGLADDQPSRVRIAAAKLLDSEDADQRERLLQLGASDRDVRVRLHAVEKLGALNDPALLPWFDARAKADAQPTIRNACARYASALRKQINE